MKAFSLSVVYVSRLIFPQDSTTQCGEMSLQGLGSLTLFYKPTRESPRCWKSPAEIYFHPKGAEKRGRKSQILYTSEYLFVQEKLKTFILLKSSESEFFLSLSYERQVGVNVYKLKQCLHETV